MVRLPVRRRMDRPVRPSCRFVPGRSTTSALEGRQLLTVSIGQISRLTSVSLRNEPVRDVIPLSLPVPGQAQQGATSTLRSYSYGTSVARTDIGGTGLEIRFSSTNPSEIGPRPVIVQVAWGDPNPSRFNPDVQTVFRNPTAGGGSWSDTLTLPHTYNTAGTYTARVSLTEVPRPGDPTPTPATALIQVHVGAFVDGSQGFFYRGSMGQDSVQVSRDSLGAILVQAQTAGQTQSITTDARRIFLDTLDGDDTISADAGPDVSFFIDAGAGADLVIGGAGADQIRGGPGNDRIFGQGGDDVIIAGAGDDEVHGGPGNDRIDGGSGSENLSGDEGDDWIFGDVGNDWLDGGLGNDLLLGGLGADRLFGGEGDDVLAGDFTNTLAPDFPASALVQGWVNGVPPRDLMRLAQTRVRQGSSDLTPLTFATLANGRKVTRPIDFGPTIANDAAIDELDGQAGRDALFGHFHDPGASRDRIVSHDNADVRFLLTDAAPRTVRNVSTFDGYVPSSGVDLTTNPTRGTYLLYKSVPDGNNLIKALNPNGQNAVEFAGYYGQPVPAAFRILNLNDYVNYTPVPVFWAGFNRPLLGYAGAFGGVILETSDLYDPKNQFDTFDGSDSPFRRELSYLTRTSGSVIELYAKPYPTYQYSTLYKAFFPSPQTA